MKWIISALVVFGVSCSLCADDWPRWLGKNGDSIWRESGIVESIPDDGLVIKWKTPIAGGYAGPAVVGDHVYVTDYVRKSGDSANDPSVRNELQGSERVLCLDAKTGEEIWKHEYDCPYKISYPAGPRATPTVDGDRVYTLGAHGHLYCLERSSGEIVWKRHLEADFDAEAPIWGFCAHPLVDGDKLICVVEKDAVAVAFDKMTGRVIWKSLTASEPGYCPPSIIDAGGKRQLLIWDADKLNGLDPETGNSYWSVPLKAGYGMSIAQPRRVGDFLFASAIQNVSALLKLDSTKPNAEVEWRSTPKTSVHVANSTPFIDNGTIYGADCQTGQFLAVDLATGDRLWETFQLTTQGTRRASHGTAFVVKHQDRFFLFTETGDLVLTKLTREKFEELGRFHVLEPTGECFGRAVVWSHPAFAQKCIFARNDKEIVCVSLAKD
ncbi:MAG: PQQ-like beta-propeller repeat protein [Planctomycetales bacterium]|nr:PQQ-like beta-propeller repeat protein [Planctomycetales bacterium]